MQLLQLRRRFNSAAVEQSRFGAGNPKLLAQELCLSNAARMEHPSVFRRRPTLPFDLSGTGKTMLANAIASEVFLRVLCVAVYCLFSVGA